MLCWATSASSGTEGLVASATLAPAGALAAHLEVRTTEPVELDLAYGPAGGPLANFRSPPGSRTAHALDLHALSPGIAYRVLVRATSRGGAREERLLDLPPRPFPTAVTADVSRRALKIGGEPFFPIFTWAQCTPQLADNLALGVNVFMGPCEDEPWGATLAPLAGRAFSIEPNYLGEVIDGPGVIGWNHPDEPDLHEISAASLLDPSKSPGGKPLFLTVTAGFRVQARAAAAQSSYTGYFARADMVGFDLYPVAALCGDPYTRLSQVATGQALLSRLSRKPTFQWLEINQLDGACAEGPWPSVTPDVLRAEAYLALAGGARGLGYFTHGWTSGPQRFDVAPEMRAMAASLSREIAGLSAAWLGGVLAAPPASSPLVVTGLRDTGTVKILIVVNSGKRPQRFTVKLRTHARHAFIVGGAGGVRTLRRGILRDSLAPLEARLYVLAPPALSSNFVRDALAAG